MLNGFDAGAGPSPRIVGGGVAVCAEAEAVASAARRRATSNRMQRVFMGGFYTGGGGLG